MNAARASALLIVGVVVGLVVSSGPGSASVGDNVILGQVNRSSVKTVLKGSGLKLIARQASPPLVIKSDAVGQPPMKVDSSLRVQGLNADLLDGFHSSAFAASDHSHGFFVLLDRDQVADVGSMGGLTLSIGCSEFSGDDSKTDLKVSSTAAWYHEDNTEKPAGTWGIGSYASAQDVREYVWSPSLGVAAVMDVWVDSDRTEGECVAVGRIAWGAVGG